jgi:transposase
MVHDPTTRAYAERRKAEGKTPREIRRCLKRYLARRLYRALSALHSDDNKSQAQLVRYRRFGS